MDGLPNAIAKGRNLIFDVQGDGNLPRISILKPISVTNKGNPLLLFNRLLTSRSQSLPLVLKNDGTLPCRLNVTLIDPEGCYTVSKEANRVSSNSFLSCFSFYVTCMSTMFFDRSPFFHNFFTYWIGTFCCVHIDYPFLC